MIGVDSKSVERSRDLSGLFRKLGLWGFMFFFVKGILWLLVPLLVAYFGIEIS